MTQDLRDKDNIKKFHSKAGDHILNLWNTCGPSGIIDPKANKKVSSKPDFFQIKE